MKQHINTSRTQRDVLTPRKTSAKKKTDKPWQLQYMWTDRTLYDKAIFGKKAKFGQWVEQFPGRMGCFIDPQHTITDVEIAMRTGNCVLCEQFYAGRHWRLFHLETKDTLKVYIDITTKQVSIEED